MRIICENITKCGNTRIKITPYFYAYICSNIIHMNHNRIYYTMSALS